MKNLEQLIRRTILKRAVGPLIVIGSLAGILGLGCEPQNQDSPQEPYHECIFNYDCGYDKVCTDGWCISRDNPSNSDSYIVTDDTKEFPSCPTKYFEDKDGDGYGDYKAWTCDPTLGIEDYSDCNDYDSLVHPGASDYCNGDGIDNNCDGKIDEEGISHYYEECYNGEKYWFDSCGKKEELIETCIGNTNCNTTCVGNEVHWQNECGGIEEKVKTCSTTEACIDGVCVCQPQCENKECGDDGCGGSCGSCNIGYGCTEKTSVSYCECTDCGGLCCFEEGDECLEYVRPYYGKQNKCIPPSSTICKTVYNKNIGFCPPSWVCAGSGVCCPPNKPILSVQSGYLHYCCDKEYPHWQYPPYPSDFDDHCDMNVSETEYGI